jgi:SAM-dependent methyltransferase
VTPDDEFAVQYRALRIREGWARPDGIEDPDGGDPRLWGGRIMSVANAAKVLSELKSGDRKPLIVDVGAGGAWATRMLSGATVLSVDLLTPPTRSNSFVQADMRHLPLLDRSADGVLFAASLHYAPVQQVIAEVARVLRPGGLMVAVDSPIYADGKAQAAAAARSEAYYSKSGFPGLASSYHPINAIDLRAALHQAGFTVERWQGPPSWLDRLRRRFGHSYTSMVVARLT